MSVLPRSGDIQFYGGAVVFFMALCRGCDVSLPFETEDDRSAWVEEHVSTGHRIDVAVDVRPQAGSIPMTRRQ